MVSKVLKLSIYLPYCHFLWIINQLTAFQPILLLLFLIRTQILEGRRYNRLVYFSEVNNYQFQLLITYCLVDLPTYKNRQTSPSFGCTSQPDDYKAICNSFRDVPKPLLLPLPIFSLG